MPNSRSQHKKRRSKRLQTGRWNDKNKKQQRSCDDVEEQLQKQRRKRALQQENSEESKPPRVLGDYRYDPVQKAYFPKDSVSSKSKKQIENSDWTLASLHHIQRNPSRRMSSLSPQALLFAAETCPVASRGRRIRSWCGLRHTLQATEVVSTLSSRQGNWRSMLSPYCESPFSSDEQDEPWDLTCKSQLTPWATTFDVSPGTCQSKMPASVSLVDGGCMLRLQAPVKTWDLNEENETYANLDGYVTNNHSLFYPAGFEQHEMCNFDTVKFQIRNDKLFDNDNYLFGAISNNHSESMFHLFATDEPPCGTSLPQPVNDFSLSISGTIDPTSLAFAPRNFCRGKELLPLFYSFTNQRCFSPATKKFPQSDVLCVEHMLHSPAEDVILYGHRNGQLTMLDNRCSDCVSVLGNPKDLSRGFGSVTKILSVPGHYTLLVKGSFGDCHVHDIRTMGGSCSISKSIRHSLSPPPGEFLKTLSSNCSGVAMDPNYSIAMYPYAAKDRQARLGMWCLATGAMVGSKRLQTTSVTTSGAMPYCELCNTVTNAYEMSSHGDNSVVGRRHGSFGLWLKCGQVEPNAPAKAGSIHHVTIPGNVRQIREPGSIHENVNRGRSS